MSSNSRQPCRNHRRRRGGARCAGTRRRNAAAVWKSSWSRLTTGDGACRWQTVAGLDRCRHHQRHPTGPTSPPSDHCHSEVETPTPETTASLITHRITTYTIHGLTPALVHIIPSRLQQCCTTLVISDPPQYKELSRLPSKEAFCSKRKTSVIFCDHDFCL